MSDNQDSQNNDNPTQESAIDTSNQDTKYLMTQTAKDILEPPKKSSPPIAISHLSKTP